MVSLVDDEEWSADALAWLLRSAAACCPKATPARGVRDRCSTAARPNGRRHPACLLLDVRMPGTSGLVLFERLIERRLLDVLPGAVPHGHGDVPHRVAARQARGVRFVEKPFADNASSTGSSRRWPRAPPRSCSAARPRGGAAPGRASPTANATLMRLVVEGRPTS
jgi:two-component system response regulator DctR